MSELHVFTIDENQASGKWHCSKELHDLNKLKEEILEEVEQKYLKRSEYKPESFDFLSLWNQFLPHLEHRYLSRDIFYKIKHDLNTKLKKEIHTWKDV